MNVLLTTAGRRTYLVDYFKASLGLNGRVLGTSDRHSTDRSLTPALFACDRHFLVPPIDDPAYLGHLLQLCDEQQVNVVVPLFDLDAWALSAALDEFLDRGIVPMFSDRRVNTIAFDKIATFEFLSEAGFSVPATFTTPQAFAASGLPFPVVLKPRAGFGSAGLAIARNQVELDAHWRAAREEAIIQEFIGGREYGLDIFASDTEVIAVVPRRKIAMRFGETDQAVSVKSKDLLDTGARLGRALRHFGPLDADLIERNGEHFLLDLNPRFGGGYPVTHMAGVDFTEFVIRLARGESLEPAIGEFEHGVVMYKDITPRRAELGA